MASRCRKVGNALEYAVCQGLQKRNISPANPATTEKLKRLKRDFDHVNEGSRVKYRKLDTVLDQLGVNATTYPRYELTDESIGHLNADTADVVLSGGAKTPLKFSIKNNNSYIKHQRPNKLYLQLVLRDPYAERFKAAYAKINDMYYERWKHLKTWDKVPTVEKFELYQRVNELTVEWISRSHARLVRYLSFVLDVSDPQKYILKWVPQRNEFAVIRHHGHDFSGRPATFTIRAAGVPESRRSGFRRR